VNSERGRHELESLLQKSQEECEQLRAQLLMSSARLRSLNQGSTHLSHKSQFHLTHGQKCILDSPHITFIYPKYSTVLHNPEQRYVLTPRPIYMMLLTPAHGTRYNPFPYNPFPFNHLTSADVLLTHGCSWPYVYS